MSTLRSPVTGSRFTCPKCGSHYFRSENVGGYPMQRFCKGAFVSFGKYSGCDFTWSQVDDGRHLRGLFPSDRLAEFEKEIRGHVLALRSEGVADEEACVLLIIRHDAPTHIRGLRRGVGLDVWFVRDRWPDIADDFAKPLKPGHVTVVVVAPEGNGVFYVKIARPA